MLTGLASSWDGRFVAFSDGGEGPVHVWAIDTHELIARFPTILGPGGSRLAISSDGHTVAAAAYGRKGVALYDARSGACLWQQRRITKVQQVGLDASGTRMWCVTDPGRAHVLAAGDGATLETVRAYWIVLHHAREEAVSFDGRQYRILHQGSTSLTTPVESGPLAGAFSDDGCCVCEVGGPLRYFDLSTRREVHRVTPSDGSHWTGVGFMASSQTFALIRYPYEHGGATILDWFDPTSGRLQEVAALWSPKYVFCDRGALMLGSQGDLRRTSDGGLVHDFHWFDLS